ncbi:MAG: hypothetical protein U9Q83_05755, partial [Bacteroidota bacterium]|nr:hypothetical protein [Bacteroidota bacterium]
LNYQKYSTDDIIELSINSLYSKLNKNDILFLKEHLFSGNFPLSNDLSQDITNRSFLSPKVAIKRAMKIDSVISKNDPMKTVLFMNFILSRLDMNEENRAMVAFLLLRVDINLPKNLEKKVFKYLLVYKDIIKELLEEEAGEIVDIDDIYGINNKIEKIKIIEEKYTPQEQIDIREESQTKDILNKNKDLKQTAQPLLLKNIEKTIKENVKTPQTLSISKSSEKKITKFLKESVEISKENSLLKEIEAKPKKDIKLKTSNTTSSREPLVLHGENSFIEKDDSNKIESYSTNTEENDISNSFSEIEHREEEKNWEISLKQNKAILESILSGISNIGSKAFILDKKNKIKNKELGESTPNNLKSKKLVYGILFLIAVILPGFFLLKNIKTKSSPVVSVIDNSEIDLLELNDKELETQNELLVPSDEKPNLEIPDVLDDFPFDITIIDGKIKWKVVPGDSITGFFFALQEFKNEFETTEFEKISNLNWNDFFDTFKRNNSKRDSYHIIFPDEEFLLPLN